MTRRDRSGGSQAQALGSRYRDLNDAKPHTTRPRAVWVRAPQDALGMTARDLADRMADPQPAVTRQEQVERTGTVWFLSLQAAADTTGCNLSYALVPRQPLQHLVDQQARLVANDQLEPVRHTMTLDGQTLTDEQCARHLDDRTQQLPRGPGLWRT